jgi:hypothetical protein
MKRTNSFPRRAVLALGIASGLGIFCDPAQAQLPRPVLDQVFPLGGQAGSEVVIDLTGRELDDLKGLHFDHPGFKAEAVDAKKEPNKFRVTLAADVPPGMHDLRAVGKFGISSARLFAVSRGLTEVRKATEPAPDEPAKAQAVSVNSAVNGQSAANGADFYRFSAKKGQRLTLDCQAFRLDSQLRGVLTLSAAGGKELARGTPYFDKIDPFIDFIVPADGDYVVGVRDLTYAGDLPYRLVISDRPQIEQVFPPAVAPGKETGVNVWGRNLPGGKPDAESRVLGLPLDILSLSLKVPTAADRWQFIDLPASPALNVRGFQAWPPGIADALNPLTLVYATDPVVLENEPNDTPEKAQAVKLPAVICGRFDRPGDVDWYAFTAKANEVIAVDLACERMGRPGDALVVVTDDKGMEVAAFDDHGANVNALVQVNRDPVGTFTAPADGTYRLQVQERNRKGGPRYTYALRVGLAKPDFYPVVYHENANDPTCPVVRQGGASYCEFNVGRRDGFAGPVTVEAEGLPRGVTCSPVHVSSQTETASIVFVAAADAPDWAGPIRLKAWTTIDGQRVERPVGSVERRFGAGNTNTVTRVCREVCMAVRSKAPYALKTTAAPLAVVAGNTLETKVTLERLWPDFKDKVQITGLNLPPGVEMESVEIPEGKKEVTVKFTVAAEVPAGKYALNLRGDAQVPFQRDPASPDKMNVLVADPATPLTVTVSAPPAKKD